MASDLPPRPDIAGFLADNWHWLSAAVGAVFGYGRLTKRLDAIDGDKGSLARMQDELNAMREELKAERSASVESRRRVWEKLESMALEMRAGVDALRADQREDNRELRSAVQAAFSALHSGE